MDSSDWRSLRGDPAAGDDARRRWARWEAKSAATEADLCRCTAPDDRPPAWLAPAFLSVLLLVWRLSSCAGDPGSAPPAVDWRDAVVVDSPPPRHEGWR